MSARAMGSATISFGLVSIPVKLYAATSEGKRISFNLLHAKCGSRLKQQYICLKDEEVVPQADMVKGYEFSKGQFVHFTKDEVKALEEKPNQSIDISEFVPLSQVDVLYYEKAYYLGPDKGGDRAYALLGKAMNKTGRAAVAQYAARGKQYLVLVRVVGNHLVMQQLRYAHELKPMDEVPLSKIDVKPSELDLATQLIEQIATTSFKADKYTDEVQARMEAAIQEKVEGKQITQEPNAAPKAQIVDLMAALKASLGVTDGEHKPTQRVESPRTKKSSRKSRTTA